MNYYEIYIMVSLIVAALLCVNSFKRVRTNIERVVAFALLAIAWPFVIMKVIHGVYRGVKNKKKGT